MTLNWLMFFPALFLLFIPLEVFFPKNLRLKELSHIDFSDAGARRRGPWRLPVVWADGVRSYLGAFLLCNAWAVDPMAGKLHHVPLVVSLFILSLAVVAQMHTRRSEGHFLAPVVYMAGIWLAMTSWPLALVAVAAGAVCMVAFRSLSAFFFFGGAMVGVFGGVVLHAGLWALAAAAVGLLPCLLGLFFKRSLAVPMRIELVKDRSREVAVTRATALNLDNVEKLEA